MKRLMLFCVVVGILLSCAPRETISEQSVDTPVDNRSVIFVHSHISDWGLSVESFNQLNPTDKALVLKAKMEVLKESNIPQNGEELSTLGWAEAQKRYVSFTENHANASYLRYFRDRYSQLILANTNLLSSGKYDVVRFFTNELLEISTQGTPVLAQSLKVLRGHLPQSEYLVLTDKADKLATTALLKASQNESSRKNAVEGSNQPLAKIVDMDSATPFREAKSAISSLH